MAHLTHKLQEILNWDYAAEAGKRDFSNRFFNAHKYRLREGDKVESKAHGRGTVDNIRYGGFCRLRNRDMYTIHVIHGDKMICYTNINALYLIEPHRTDVPKINQRVKCASARCQAALGSNACKQ